MVEFTKTLKVGDGTEEGVFLGPIQNSMQYEKVKVRPLLIYDGAYTAASSPLTVVRLSSAISKKIT